MTETHPKIAVLGAGSIGCYLGGLLVNSGLAVSFIGRERYRSQIAENGLTLTHFANPDLNMKAIDFQTDASALTGADVILLCTKSQDTEAAAQQIQTHARTAQVVSFQNGIRNPEILRAALPDADIIPAIVPFNVTPTGPGKFHSGTAGALIVGDGANMAMMEGFRAAGQPIKVDSGILSAQWTKMIVNLNNALNTLTGGTLMEGLTQRDYRRAMILCLEEAMDVAKANGITPGEFNGRRPEQLLTIMRLPNVLYKLTMRMITKIDDKARSSMLDDLEGGRVSEINYLQGEIVRHAQIKGMNAPRNAKILALTQDAFAAGKSPNMSGKDILNAISG